MIGYGIIGAGWVAPSHAWGVTHSPHATLVAVADTNVRRARALAADRGADAVRDYRELLARDDIQAVSICLPDFLHEEVALAAADHGKHVLCEKPLARTVAECDQMIDAFERARLGLGIVLNHRYDPENIRTMRAVRSGAIGRPVMAAVVHSSSFRGNPAAPGEWRGRGGRVGGGVMTMQTIHFLDLVLWSLGPVASVQAGVANLAHPDEDTEDVGSMTLRLRSGSIASVIATNASPTDPELDLTRMEIHGTEGAIIHENMDVALWNVRADYVPPEESPRPEIPDVARGLLFGSGHIHQVAEFVAAVIEGEAPPISPREGRHLTAVMNACYESAATGRAVEITNIGDAYDHART